MEVTFGNSGALSRAHYSLVQRVENAQTSQAVNDIIVQEVNVIRNVLTRGARGSSLRAECLIMLMFCQTILTINIPGLFYFALPHAVQLVESGRSLRDRRIAYQYCIQCIPPGHEMNLMLVNTIRKDLESHDDSRISLALDYLTQSPTNDVIPAISASLEGLMSSKSSSIKRQALVAIRSLLKFDIGIAAHLTPRLLKRAKGSELGIAVIALDLLLDSRQSIISVEDITQVLLQRMSTVTTQSQPVIKALELLEKIFIINTSIPHCDVAADVLLQLLSVTGSRTPMEYGVSLGACRCISYLPPSKVVKRLGPHPESVPMTPLAHLRPLLLSDDPNAAYTFLTCLVVLDPSLWTGSGMEFEHSELTTLKEQEVGKIMMFLDSNDATLRQKAYAVVKAADMSLLEAHYVRVMNVVSILPLDNVSGGGQPAMRALEILDALKPSSKAYVDGVKNILNKIEQPYSTSTSKGNDSPTTGSTARNIRHSLPVMESLVEKVLSHLALASLNDRKTFIEDLITADIAHPSGSPHSPHSPHSRDSRSCPYGATGYTLLAAAAAEYGHLSHVSPDSLLQALSRPLKLASPAVQEVLLLSILKILALCNQSPFWLFETVAAIKTHAGRHIAFRCQQVLDFSDKLKDLRRIVASSISTSLPDFLFALEKGPLPSLELKMVSSPRSEGTKLRYTSYEPPPAAPRGRRRRTSSSNSTSRSSVSRSYQEVPDIDDPHSRTISAGELALTGESQWFQQQPSRQRSPYEGKKDLDLITDRIDLISLDTPFRTENQIQSTAPELIPLSSSPPLEEFGRIWDQSNGPTTSARGWSSSSPDALQRRLDASSSLSVSVVQKEPHDPFIPDTAEILILARSFHEGSEIAIKLKLEDGESCLWQIRGHDQDVVSELKRLFTEED